MPDIVTFANLNLNAGPPQAARLRPGQPGPTHRHHHDDDPRLTVTDAAASSDRRRLPSSVIAADRRRARAVGAGPRGDGHGGYESAAKHESRVSGKGAPQADSGCDSRASTQSQAPP